MRPEELAEFMHDTYEKVSKEFGWKTQESCQVKFDNLPSRNKIVMIAVATEVIKKCRKVVK